MWNVLQMKNRWTACEFEMIRWHARYLMRNKILDSSRTAAQCAHPPCIVACITIVHRLFIPESIPCFVISFFFIVIFSSFILSRSTLYQIHFLINAIACIQIELYIIRQYTSTTSVLMHMQSTPSFVMCLIAFFFPPSYYSDYYCVFIMRVTIVKKAQKIWKELRNGELSHRVDFGWGKAAHISTWKTLSKWRTRAIKKSQRSVVIRSELWLFRYFDIIVVRVIRAKLGRRLNPIQYLKFDMHIMTFEIHKLRY